MRDGRQCVVESTKFISVFKRWTRRGDSENRVAKAKRFSDSACDVADFWSRSRDSLIIKQAGYRLAMCRSSSASTERIFSALGRICVPSRNRLSIDSMFNLLPILVAESEAKLRRGVRSRDATIDPEEVDVELVEGPPGEAAILDDTLLTRASDMEYPESFVNTGDYSKLRELMNFDLVMSGASDQDHGQKRPSNSHSSRSERAQQITDSILPRRHS